MGASLNDLPAKYVFPVEMEQSWQIFATYYANQFPGTLFLLFISNAKIQVGNFAWLHN